MYDRVGLDQSPPTADSRRIKRYVNRWQRRVLTAHGMTGLRRVIVPNASVINQQTYGIVLNKILWVTETSTERRLRLKTLGWYREQYPDPANMTGTPDWYVPMGMSRVHTRPANASELFVKSTSASDTNTASVEVIRSTGYRRSLSVTMTGTTAVSLGAAITDVIDVVNFYLSAAAVGTVTLHEDSGTGTELSRIPIGAIAGRFLRYALAPTPSKVITYNFDGVADVRDLTDDNEESLIPFDFRDILVDGAVHDEWVMRGRVRDAEQILNGGRPTKPPESTIEGRIRLLRASIFEFPEDEGEADAKTFDETITLPIT